MTDALATLAATPKSLAQLVAEATDAELDDTRGNGGTSARRRMTALRDAESLGWRRALERALAEESPDVAAPDLDGWEERRGRERDQKARILGDFALQRQASIARLEALTDTDWDRPLRLAGEALTIAGLVERWAAADAEALSAVERALGTTLGEVMQRRFPDRH